MFNQYLKIKNGNGVYTTIDINANLPIMEFHGTLYTNAELKDPNHPAILQVGLDSYLFSHTQLGENLRHSCNPNCLMHIVGNRAILYSMYLIKAGSELTFDYSTTSTDSIDQWSMNCQCGSVNCRGIISGFQHLGEDIKQDMKKKGVLPLYITNPEKFEKI